MSECTTVRLQRCLDRLHAGEQSARAELLDTARRRLLHLARKMFHSWPRLREWEETDDILQNAMLRLWQALARVKLPSLRDFFRLAAEEVRRELIDLARRYFGAQGIAAQLRSARGGTSMPGFSMPDVQSDLEQLEAWTNFHAEAGLLPDEERELFGLLWYQGLTQEEAARMLGVNLRTVERRWRRAKFLLHKALDGKLPPL